ncbi:N-acetylneuraminate synthase [Chitinophaga ginsengisegetis]|uniref:N-acetylneuraminate synthase n=1 Tax=Chitinophaga ginsengisegetis TaxID=393003 RepID=UPI003422BB8C
MKKTIIIAEAGVNHNGNPEQAKALIDVAAGAGVDYVKFQTFRADKIATSYANKAAYQEKHTEGGSRQLEMLRKLEMSVAMHEELIAYSKQKGITFLSTPFDMESIDLLVSLGITLGKIPSGEITNLPYLRKMATSFEQLILSTGMATLEEVKEALAVLQESGKKLEDITVLHCTSEYPSPIEDVNLLAMLTMKRELNVEVGYSDHTLGIEVPVAAVALGAVLIEKHFTLDKTMEGPDQAASLEPDELKSMVLAIRNIEKALGNGTKQPTAMEEKNKLVARKSIVAAKPIAGGEVFTIENITVKRPGTGVSAMRWDEVIGKTAGRNFETDELITL